MCKFVSPTTTRLTLFLNSVGHVWFVRHLQDTARISQKKRCCHRSKPRHVCVTCASKACCALCSSYGRRRGSFSRTQGCKVSLFEKGHYLDKQIVKSVSKRANELNRSQTWRNNIKIMKNKAQCRKRTTLISENVVIK